MSGAAQADNRPAALDGQPRLRMGVLGLGMAGGIMVPVIQRHGTAVLTAAADPNPELRRRFQEHNALDACASARELCERDDVDAVYIATPHQFHREHAILAAENGKHMIVEKPMALTLADCDAMIEAAGRHGVQMIVGHTHSFDPGVRVLRQATLDGSLGRLAMVSMWNFTDFMYRPRRPEELDTAKGGGILFNQIPHQVNVARAVAAEPVRSVRAMAGVLDASRPTEGCASAFIDFENGAVATLAYSGYDHFDSDELHGWIGATGRRKQLSHGRTLAACRALDSQQEITVRQERYGYGSNFHQGAAPGQPHFGLVIASYEHGDLRLTPTGVSRYDEDGMHELVLPPSDGGGRTEVLDELCNAVLRGEPALHDGAFSRETLRACLAIQLSARERREIMLAGEHAFAGP